MPRRIRIGHIRAIRISGDMGGYALTGQAATVSRTAYMAAGNGGYSVAGQSATFATSTIGGSQSSGIYEPTITNEPQIEQYATWDSGSGPTFKHWSTQLGMPWVNVATGDFTDANDIAQGATPFATTNIPTAGAYYSFNVAALITRALAAGVNKGFYLRAAGSGAAVICTGRTGASPPLLQVVTSAGTFNCACLTNANWVPQATSSLPLTSPAQFTLQSTWLGIIRFDLVGVSGTVISATMQIHVSSRFGSGTAVQVFEAAPPTFRLGASELTPVLGLAAAVGEAALETHPDVYMAGDFAGTTLNLAGGTASIPKLFSNVNVLTGVGSVEILPDTDAPGTYMWRGSFVPVFTGQAPARQAFDGTKVLMLPDLTNPLRPPANVVEEAYYRQYVYLEEDFITTADGNKMGISWDLRMGYFTSTGFWQHVSGNGGDRGDGKRYQYVIGGSEKYVYEGHLERTECGVNPGDGSPYSLVKPFVGYNYHIDQGGPFPGGLSDENGGPVYGNVQQIKFKQGRWYCIEQRLKMNTINLTTVDAQGNGVANFDGILQTWIDGILVDSRTNFRWRHHPQMGICQVNANWYMGGVQNMPDTMHFRLNHFVVAKQYIGPRVRPLPSYVPAVNNIATLTVANGWLTNNLIDVCAPYYQETQFWNIRNGDSGPALNPYWGTYGGMMLFGCGHSSTNDNTVAILEFGATAMTFKRLTNPTPLFGTGTSEATQSANSTTSVVGRDLSWGEYTVDSQPCSAHTYGSGDVIGPVYGGAANGTFQHVIRVACGHAGELSVLSSHKVDMPTTSGAAGSYVWERASTDNPGNITSQQPIPCFSMFVPAQNRIYYDSRWATASRTPRWFDRTTGLYAIGTGTSRPTGSDSYYGGRLLHVPERNLLIFGATYLGVMRLYYMPVGVANTNPSWVTTPAVLSSALSTPPGWSAICWCPDNSRLLVINVTGNTDKVFEITIPATLSSPWTVEAVTIANGTLPIPQQSLSDALSVGAPVYKGWDYNTKTKCVVYYPVAKSSAPQNETVYLYRPRNT